MLRKRLIDAENALPAKPKAMTVRPPTEGVLSPGPTFVPLALRAPTAEGEIRIELQRIGKAGVIRMT